MTTVQEPTGTAAGFSTLETAVLETLVYSDLFDFPLTAEELRRWLGHAATQREVEILLEAGPLSSLVIRDGEYLALRGREEVFARRRQRQANTRRLRRKAEQCGRVISHLPFVRMVAITGSIAADNAAEGADLDFMIVTAPGRVWTVRALSMVVVRFWSLRGVTVCPNYLLAESALALPERDRYTARELLQMLPVGASHAYERMLRENEWWRDFLPNATPRAHARPAKLTLGRRIIEGMMSTELFDLAERWLMRRKASELRGQATTTEAVFSAEMCKGHFENWRARTEQATAERLKALLERKS